MTVTVPQEPNKRNVQAHQSDPIVRNINRGNVKVTRINEGVLPPQSVPVGGRLCQLLEGWKHITNDPFVFSIVAKGYRLRFRSPPLLLQTPWEIRFPQGTQKIQGMREQISLMLQKNAISEISPDTPGFYLNVFLVRKASGGWRPVIDLQQLNHTDAHLTPHCMHTISSVLSTVKRGEYAFKIDLQDAYFHVLIYPNSRKTYGIPVSSTPLRSEHCPQVCTCLGHTVAAYLHRQGISVIPYLDDWLIHYPDRQLLLHHQSQLLDILNMVGLRLNEAKSDLEAVQDIQFLSLGLHFDQGSASLSVSKAWEIMAHTCRISSQKTLSYKEVSRFMGSLNWASGLIPLGRLHLRPLQWHFHSLGLTNQFSPPRR